MTRVLTRGRVLTRMGPVVCGRLSSGAGSSRAPSVVCPSGISVVIPVHNGGELFRRCLASLASCTPAACEIIVADDGSTDDSARLASNSGARVLRIENRRGPAHARNHGAQHAANQVILFLDADVTVRSDIIDRVGAVFANDPGLSALFGSYDDAPAATNFLSQYKNLLHHFVHQTAREEGFTFWSGCGAIQRDVFLELGGFDEQYRRPAIEDIELGYRMRRAGHRVLLLKELQVKHLKPWSAAELIRTDFVRRALPWSELILRHRAFANDLNIGWASRLSVLAAGALTGGLLGALAWPPLLAAAGVSAVALILLNWPLYRFFLQKRGPLFVLKAIPWHWFYFLYSGVAFGLALVMHLMREIGLPPGACKVDRFCSKPPGSAWRRPAAHLQPDTSCSKPPGSAGLQPGTPCSKPPFPGAPSSGASSADGHQIR